MAAKGWRPSSGPKQRQLPEDRKSLIVRYMIDAEEAQERARLEAEQLAARAAAEERARLAAEQQVERAEAEERARLAAEEEAARAAAEEREWRIAQRRAARAAFEEQARRVAEEESRRAAEADSGRLFVAAEPETEVSVAPDREERDELFVPAGHPEPVALADAVPDGRKPTADASATSFEPDDTPAPQAEPDDTPASRAEPSVGLPIYGWVEAARDTSAQPDPDWPLELIRMRRERGVGEQAPEPPL